MQEECGERDSLDFRTSLPAYVSLDVAGPATDRQATKRNLEAK
jgi:hypothetical protein